MVKWWRHARFPSPRLGILNFKPLQVRAAGRKGNGRDARAEPDHTHQQQPQRSRSSRRNRKPTMMTLEKAKAGSMCEFGQGPRIDKLIFELLYCFLSFFSMIITSIIDHRSRTGAPCTAQCTLHSGCLLTVASLRITAMSHVTPRCHHLRPSPLD
jgi:hypothetical protein